MRVTFSIASSIKSVMAGIDFFKAPTLATSVAVERFWRVFTRRRGSSGKLCNGMVEGGLV